MGKMDQK